MAINLIWKSNVVSKLFIFSQFLLQLCLRRFNILVSSQIFSVPRWGINGKGQLILFYPEHRETQASRRKENFKCDYDNGLEGVCHGEPLDYRSLS
jgi:hypothetical protein